MASSLRREAKSLYKKITLNRLTASFFVFGFIHCFVQGVIHSLLFSIDAEYSNLLTGISRAAQVPRVNHTYWDGENSLFMCNYIPHNSTTCSLLYQPGDPVPAVDGNTDSRGDFVINGLAGGLTAHNTAGNPANLTGNPGGVTLTDSSGQSITLSTLCISTLLYPAQLLQNYKREDLTWVFLQFYLLILSVAAMIYDSVPHLIASLFARIIYTMWGIYAIYRTQQRKKTFYDVIEAPGTPCSIGLFRDYDQVRFAYEIPDLVLSLSALVTAAYLTREVYRVYKSQFFRCMGAPEAVARVYKWFMAVQATLHLELFVLLTAMGLWIDQLFNSYIAHIATHTAIYKAGFILTTCLMVPWIFTGYYSIRNEHRLLLMTFLGITLFPIIGWGAIFYSDTYRWTFIAWPGLAGFSTLSFILLIATFTLGFVSLRNFGRGLKEYLRAERELRKMGFGETTFVHAGSEQEKVGISWDPPPLKKVTIQRPGDNLSVEESDALGGLPNLDRTKSHERKESIASFYA